MKQFTITGRILLSVLCLVLPAGVAVAQQTRPLTPIALALDITSSMDKESYD